MKSIIINTLKISVAAILAILCAQALRLDFAVSAGIVAILSVQPTKKETLRTALARLFAFAVALVIPSTAPMLSAFLKKISVEYHKDNDVKALLDELAQIHNKMKNVPLPQTRTEFEDRANLFTLMERLKDFLQVKRDFMISQNTIAAPQS